MFRIHLLITISYIFFSLIAELPAGKRTELKIGQWLSLGPVEQPFPAFHTQENINGKTFDLDNLLKFSNMDIISMNPAEGRSHGNLEWNTISPKQNGMLELKTGSQIPSIQYLAVYLKANRWLDAQIRVAGAHPFQVYLNGQLLGSKSGSENTTAENGGEPGSVSKEIILENGSHLLLIKTINDPENPSPWTVDAAIELKDSIMMDELSLSLSPDEIMSMEKLLNSPEIKGRLNRRFPGRSP